MASKGGSSSPPKPPAVCCMCGDEGLTQELFRCKLCLVRSQHRYCSNQYPNVEFYTLCNWCLREEGSNPSRKEAVKEGYSNMNASNISSSGNNDSNDIDNANREVNNNNTNTTTNASSSSTSSGVKLHRLHFSSQFDNPIKKPRILNRSASDVTDPIRSTTGEISPRLGKARQVFKAKVRRYKLLEEVSS